MGAPPRRLEIIDAAAADLERIGEDDRRLKIRALAVIELVVSDEIRGRPLLNTASTGDLSDCFKVYFGINDEPTHRLVYRLLPDGTIEVVQVVAVEQRDEAYVYLLAAHRLGTLPHESRRRFNRVHQAVVARRGRTRKSTRRRSDS
jgi:hypothetical protein